MESCHDKTKRQSRKTIASYRDNARHPAFQMLSRHSGLIHNVFQIHTLYPFWRYFMAWKHIFKLIYIPEVESPLKHLIQQFRCQTQVFSTLVIKAVSDFSFCSPPRRRSKIPLERATAHLVAGLGDVRSPITISRRSRQSPRDSDYFCWAGCVPIDSPTCAVTHVRR